MSPFLNTITACFSRELITHLAARLGETEAGVRTALDGIVPLVLGGLINRAGMDNGEGVYRMAQNACQAADGYHNTLVGVLGLLGSGAAYEGGLAQGERLLATLFGAGSCSIGGPISQYAAIRPASARTLLRLAGAVLPDLLGQFATAHKLQAREMAKLLFGLKKKVRAMLPAALTGLTALLWLGGLGNTARQTVATTKRMRPMHRRLMEAASGWYQMAAGAVGTAVLAYVVLTGGLTDTDVTGESAVAPAARSVLVGVYTYCDSAEVYEWLTNTPEQLSL